MGKTTAGRLLHARGIPVFNADRVVHGLLQSHGPVVAQVAQAFPQAMGKGQINRALLGELILSTPGHLEKLEALLHPHVEKALTQFMALQVKRRALFVFLEIPLLYELGWDLYCDSVIVMTCPPWVQKSRLMARPGMTQQKYEFMQSRQLPQEEKCQRADYVISSQEGIHPMLRQLLQVLIKIRSHYARNCLRHRNHRPKP
jgi:dephospho-CoA kinase